MRVILWIAMFLTTVVTVSGKGSTGPLSQLRGMRNPRCISCSEVKEAHLCESCCKRPVCDPNPCKNDGMCSPDDNGYSCICTPGYLGERCDVDVCLPNPCKNNGTCSPVDNGYSCNCATGYLGKTCDVNPCDIYNPCTNNGTCYPSEFGVNCSCLPGFIGEYCQVTECGGFPIFRLVCFDLNATNCSGEACNITNNEACIGGRCVDAVDYCERRDGINKLCINMGVPCGDGQYCKWFNKCVNDTCRPDCYTQTDGVCKFDNLSGTCSVGACLVPCVVDKDCRGFPCVGGYCALPKCGELFCRFE